MLHNPALLVLIMLLSPALLAAQRVPANEPTPAEQYFHALVNRARADPAAEARRLKIDLNEGLAPGTLNAKPKQPLAMNPALTVAAREHTRWMMRRGAISHEGAGNSQPHDRVQAAGYKLVPPAGTAENLGFVGQTQSAHESTDAVDQLHDGLFIDEGVAGRGHRINILRDDFRESGVAVMDGDVQMRGQTFHSWMATHKIAYTKGDAFLTGVVFSDRVKGDRFYTPGEGIGQVTITATRTTDSRAFTTKTWASGGYTLQLPRGSYRVSASGGTLPAEQQGGTVRIANENIAVDFIVP